MPTRILYWNIRQFSLTRIYGSPEARERLDFIVNRIVQPAQPQIFVVVEVTASNEPVSSEGTVLGAYLPSGQAVLVLLNELRTRLANPYWCLVPPLYLGLGGQREAVAVFFNAAVLQFQGPDVFYLTNPGATVPIIQGQPVTATTVDNFITDYPDAWKNCLPWSGNPMPALRMERRTGFNEINVPEWQLAGQWEYFNGNNRIYFPNDVNRGPFWTQFQELATARTLNLFAVHTSPDTAGGAVINMGEAAEMANPPGANTVNVIFGDFNVDSYTEAAAAYNWMVGADGVVGHYTMQLDPRVNHAGDPILARQPYLLTHLLSTPQATPFNAVGFPTGPDPQHNVYPRYGYMGSVVRLKITDSGAIDNFFTAYGAGAGAAANITVVNPIVGTPYNAMHPPPGVTGELIGGLPYGSALANPIPLGGVNPNDPTAAAQQAVFMLNFDKIFSVSDHLPLILDV